LKQTDKNFERIQKYLLNAKHYHENSTETLKKKELGKSGELLWGAIAESSKALHLKKYATPINTHNLIKEFLGKLSTIYRRKDLQVWKRSANSLHVNFYETHLDEPTFLEFYNDGLKLYAFLVSNIMKPSEKPIKQIN